MTQGHRHQSLGPRNQFLAFYTLNLCEVPYNYRKRNVYVAAKGISKHKLIKSWFQTTQWLLTVFNKIKFLIRAMRPGMIWHLRFSLQHPTQPSPSFPRLWMEPQWTHTNFPGSHTEPVPPPPRHPCPLACNVTVSSLPIPPSAKSFIYTSAPYLHLLTLAITGIFPKNKSSFRTSIVSA